MAGTNRNANPGSRNMNDRETMGERARNAIRRLSHNGQPQDPPMPRVSRRGPVHDDPQPDDPYYPNHPAPRDLDERLAHARAAVQNVVSQFAPQRHPVEEPVRTVAIVHAEMKNATERMHRSIADARSYNEDVKVLQAELARLIMKERENHQAALAALDAMEQQTGGSNETPTGTAPAQPAGTDKPVDANAQPRVPEQS
jgi:hypothetical protein